MSFLSAMVNCKLMSFNVRGLGEYFKRKTIWTWIRKQSTELAFLQETHSTASKEAAWKNEWGGKVFGTSFGHPGDFAEESFVRMLVNAVHWSVGRPIPEAAEKMSQSGEDEKDARIEALQEILQDPVDIVLALRHIKSRLRDAPSRPYFTPKYTRPIE